MNLDVTKERLLNNNNRYRSLHDKHQSLEARLQEISSHKYRSEEDEKEMKSIKHEKLLLKQEMETLAHAEVQQTH